MEQNKARDILHRYGAGMCTAEERRAVERWFLAFNADEIADVDDHQLKAIEDEIWAGIMCRRDRIRRMRRLLPRFTAAAALIIATCLFIYHSEQIGREDTQVTSVVAHIAPGGNRATLTLEDGSSIDLDQKKSGIVVSGDAWTYADGGAILDGTQVNRSRVQYATLTTPKGGQYQVSLADGTKVWLNAESSLTYPAQFNGKKREVKLSGEAYFEVAGMQGKDGGKLPFIVVTSNQQVEVLGTHFNIHAYQDEMETQTTLVEGKVRITHLTSKDWRLLKPNEQSTVSANSSDIAVRTVDPEEAVAWKAGYFIFEGTNLGQIMREVERWYNVSVEFDDPALKDELYSGAVSRYNDASKVLEVLALTGNVAFNIKDRTIQVSATK